MPTRGTPALMVADVDGVKVGGLLFESGPVNSENLVVVGEPGSQASHAADPIFLYDICCRAGGAKIGTVTCFLTINSRDVVGDNFWLSRADHGTGERWESDPHAVRLRVKRRD